MKFFIKLKHVCRGGMVGIGYMRGPVALALLPAKCWFRQMYSMNGSPGLLAILTPEKQEKNEFDKTVLAIKEMIDPIAAFRRPPQLPPVIGPLVALSLLETWWNRGTDEDGK
ncbi:hypothetical protein VNO78_07732 [Psophocarpus tetragonolobus]|uniref:Uncharacterized protein n=1 Tax=Psophocarpus tetragonolobus TaxID=3891 RepID=A0AAN9SWN2_PSOTE